jgi:hypothetical protein
MAVPLVKKNGNQVRYGGDLGEKKVKTILPSYKSLDSSHPSTMCECALSALIPHADVGCFQCMVLMLNVLLLHVPAHITAASARMDDSLRSRSLLDTPPDPAAPSPGMPMGGTDYIPVYMYSLLSHTIRRFMTSHPIAYESWELNQLMKCSAV